MTMTMNGRTEFPDFKPRLSGFSGFDIIQLLRRNSGLIVLVSLLGLLLTGVWISRQSPIYVSSAAVVLRGSDLPSDMNSNSSVQGAVSPMQMFTEVEVMSSRDFIADLADELRLLEDPRYNPALAEPSPSRVDWLVGLLRAPANSGDSSGLAAVRDTLAALLSRLPLPTPEDPRALGIEEQRDAAIEKLTAQIGVSASDRHNVVRIQVRSPDPFTASHIANTAADLYIRTRANEQRRDVDRLITFLTQRRDEIARGLSTTQAEAAALIRDFGLRDTTETQLLIAENARLQNILEAASPTSPRIPELKARIAEIDTQLDSRVKAEIKLTERELALKTETARFDAVQQRLDELTAQRETPPNDVAQIARAEVPVNPIGPLVGPTLVVALLASTLMGIVIAILRENIDRRVTSQTDAEEAAGVEMITSLPKLTARVMRRHGGPTGVVRTRADNGYANGISALVTTVMRDAAEGRAQTVLIGSSVSGEGKSSITSAMAVSAAMDDLKVLLIDFDVYRSGATQYLDVAPGKLSMNAMLRGEKPIEEFITETRYARLDVMNFKPHSRVSRRVLRTEMAADVFDSVRGHYDLILIDTPPFLASEEAGRLTSIVDQAILVSGWRMCTQEALATTAQRMQKADLDVVGVVINGINPKQALAYGYYSYSAAYDGKEYA